MLSDFFKSHLNWWLLIIISGYFFVSCVFCIYLYSGILLLIVFGFVCKGIYGKHELGQAAE